MLVVNKVDLWSNNIQEINIEIFTTLNEFVKSFRTKEHIKVIFVTIENHLDWLTTNLGKYYNNDDKFDNKKRVG